MKIIKDPQTLELKIKASPIQRLGWLWLVLLVTTLSSTGFILSRPENMNTLVKTKIIQRTDTFYILDKDLKFIPKRIKVNIPVDCHNPGNVTAGNPEADKLAIGTYNVGEYRFLVFPTPEHGYKALKAVLKSYGNYTIAGMLNKYCPGHSNYLNLFKDPNKLVKDEDQDYLCKVIMQKEGWK